MREKPWRFGRLAAGAVRSTGLPGTNFGAGHDHGRRPRALIDAQIFAWHQEAAGYKIRHVPDRIA